MKNCELFDAAGDAGWGRTRRLGRVTLRRDCLSPTPTICFSSTRHEHPSRRRTMLLTVPFLAALCLTPGQADGLTLTGARVTYGILGPTRDNTKFLAGDTLYVSFTIEGIT